MDRHILEFARLLRRAGIRISSTEVNDCLAGIRLIGLKKPLFFEVLRATLIKEERFFPVFKLAFDLFFDKQVKGRFLVGGDAKFSAGLGDFFEESFAETKDSLCRGTGQGAGAGTGYSKRFVHIIKVGDADDYKEFVREGIVRLSQFEPESLEDPDKFILKVKVLLEWNMGVNSLRREAENDEEAGQHFWLWQARISEIEEILHKELNVELVKGFGIEALKKILERENLNQIDFCRLKDNQLEEMRKRVARLGNQLAVRTGFRKERAKKGTVDMAKTLRRSLGTGGIPINLAFRNRSPGRPEFWVLCDLSGSMKIFSEFVLQLMYTMQNKFLHMKSFVFVDAVDQASDCFSGWEITEAITNMYNNLKFSKTGFSDYGQVLQEFYKLHGEDMNKRITLFIVGDARNNYRPHNADYLQLIKEKVKRIIWLNPETQLRWNTEDSIIGRYSQFCTTIYECRNLEQLTRVAKSAL